MHSTALNHPELLLDELNWNWNSLDIDWWYQQLFYTSIHVLYASVIDREKSFLDSDKLFSIQVLNDFRRESKKMSRDWIFGELVLCLPRAHF